MNIYYKGLAIKAETDGANITKGKVYIIHCCYDDIIKFIGDNNIEDCWFFNTGSDVFETLHSKLGIILYQ